MFLLSVVMVATEGWSPRYFNNRKEFQMVLSALVELVSVTVVFIAHLKVTNDSAVG